MCHLVGNCICSLFICSALLLPLLFIPTSKGFQKTLYLETKEVPVICHDANLGGKVCTQILETCIRNWKSLEIIWRCGDLFYWKLQIVTLLYTIGYLFCRIERRTGVGIKDMCLSVRNLALGVPFSFS